MDTDANSTDSADIQESLMGALIGSRGVPGGIQGLSAETAEAESEPVDDDAVDEEIADQESAESTELAGAEISAETASMLGISSKTLEAVKQATEPESQDPEKPANAPLEDSVIEDSVLEEPDPAPPVAPPVTEQPVPVEVTTAETVPQETVPQETVPQETVPEAVEASIDNLDDPDPDGAGRVILEWAVVLVGAVVMALVLRQFIFQAFWIPSESMETTLEISDRVLVNRLSYQWGDVGRGDVVVFERKPEEVGEIRDLIKRVIGLPGESVEGRDNVIYIDGIRLDEPYVAAENQSFANFGPVVVPDNELFVMGDNRDQSFDSRLFGTVDVDRVAGRAFVTFWPLSRAGSL